MFALLGYGLAPLAAAGVAALGTVALVALYLLREREQRVAVAFVALWDPGGGQKRLERIGRRLRRWLSLLLQLAILWLLVLALVDPRPAARARSARSWLLMIDRSASMGSRLKEARTLARQVLAGLPPDDRAMVATFAREAVAASGFEASGPVLEAAVEGVSAGEEGTDVARAFAFATAVLRGRPAPVLVLISDGHLAAPALPGVEVRFLPVGTAGPNVALMGFSARRRPLDDGAVDATAVLHNFADRAASGTLEVSAGTRVLERVPVTLAPGEAVTRTVGPLATIQAELEARFLPAGADLLAFDDRAFAVVPERERRRVLVVGAPNLYLDGAASPLHSRSPAARPPCLRS